MRAFYRSLYGHDENFTFVRACQRLGAKAPNPKARPFANALVAANIGVERILFYMIMERVSSVNFPYSPTDYVTMFAGALREH
jgi:hypothetical protein